MYLCPCNNKMELLPPEIERCSSCNKKILEVNSVCIYDFNEKLISILSNEKLYEMLMKNCEKNRSNPPPIPTEDSQIGDIKTGFLYTRLMQTNFPHLAKLGLTLTLFFDKTDMQKNSRNKNALYVKGVINELDGNERFKNIITFLSVQDRGEEDNNVIFEGLVCHLQQLLINKQEITVTHYIKNENGEYETIQKRISFVALTIVIIIDKFSAGLVMVMVLFSGYISCWTCLDIGYKHGHSGIFYAIDGPFENYKVALRDENWHDQCLHEKKTRGIDSFGGVKNCTVIARIPGTDSFLKYVNDMLHTMELGFIESFFEKCKYLDKPFMDCLIQLSMTIKRLRIFKGHPTDLKNTSLLKVIDWRYQFRYYLPILFLVVSKDRVLFGNKERSDCFMRMFNQLATFNEQMNRKNSSLSVKEIWDFQAQLLSVQICSFCVSRLLNGNWKSTRYVSSCW